MAWVLRGTEGCSDLLSQFGHCAWYRCREMRIAVSLSSGSLLDSRSSSHGFIMELTYERNSRHCQEHSLASERRQVRRRLLSTRVQMADEARRGTARRPG